MMTKISKSNDTHTKTIQLEVRHVSLSFLEVAYVTLRVLHKQTGFGWSSNLRSNGFGGARGRVLPCMYLLTWICARQNARKDTEHHSPPKSLFSMTETKRTQEKSSAKPQWNPSKPGKKSPVWSVGEPIRQSSTDPLAMGQKDRVPKRPYVAKRKF